MKISYRKRKEFLTLIKYFLVTAVTAIPVTIVIGEAWNETPWGLPLQAITAIHHGLQVGLLIPYFFLLGVFLGPMVLLLVDKYKRMQGIVAWTGLALVASLVLIPRDILLGQLVREATAVGVGVFVLGLLLGLYASGFSHALLSKRNPDLTFPAAPQRLFQFTILIVVVGFIEAALVYRSPIYVSNGEPALRSFEFIGFSFDGMFLLGIVSGGFLLYGLSLFLRYESSARTIQIGPQRSGKTASFGGLYAWVDETNPGALLDNNGTGAEIAEDMASKIENGEFPSTTEMNEMAPLGVSYETNGWFKEELELQGVDYPGESLANVLSPIIDQNDNAPLTDGGQSQDFPTDGQSSGDQQQGESPDSISFNEPERPDPGEFQSDDDRDSDYLDYNEADSWHDAIQNVQKVATENAHDHAGAAVWNCIVHADRVILTIPFDDYIGPIVERDNLVNYKRISMTGNKSSIDQKESILCEVDETVYYDPDRPDRPAPHEYLGWYVRLCQHLNEKEYIVAVTKADLAINDFKGHPYNEMDAFRDHLADVMEDVEKRTQRLIQNTHENRPFALWYRIENDDPPTEDSKADDDENLKIDKKIPNGPILRGAQQLLERLEQ